MVLDGEPVNGVLAPVGTVVGFPVLGASRALGAVGDGGYGDEVLWVRQVVGVEPFALSGPSPGAAPVGVAQRNHVVDVQFAGVGDGGGGIGRQPLA